MGGDILQQGSAIVHCFKMDGKYHYYCGISQADLLTVCLPYIPRSLVIKVMAILCFFYFCIAITTCIYLCIFVSRMFFFKFSY